MKFSLKKILCAPHEAVFEIRGGGGRALSSKTFSQQGQIRVIFSTRKKYVFTLKWVKAIEKYTDKIKEML